MSTLRLRRLRGCTNDADSFCYICGRFTKKKVRRNIILFIKNAYYADFGMKLGNQDKSWAPHKVCIACMSTFSLRMKGKKHFSFGVPMVWREPQNHFSDCYFCAVKTTGLTSKTRSSVDKLLCHQQFNQFFIVMNSLYQHSMVFSSAQ